MSFSFHSQQPQNSGGVSDSFLSFFTSQNKKTQEFNASISSKLDSIQSSFSSLSNVSRDLEGLKLSSNEIRSELNSIQQDGSKAEVGKEVSEVKKDLKRVMEGADVVGKKVDELNKEVRSVKQDLAKILQILSNQNIQASDSVTNGKEEVSIQSNDDDALQLTTVAPGGMELVRTGIQAEEGEIPPTVEGKPNLIIDIGETESKQIECRLFDDKYEEALTTFRGIVAGEDNPERGRGFKLVPDPTTKSIYGGIDPGQMGNTMKANWGMYRWKTYLISVKKPVYWVTEVRVHTRAITQAEAKELMIIGEVVRGKELVDEFLLAGGNGEDPEQKKAATRAVWICFKE